jgi:PIN domain nuclease of toxin-antitoxin system
MRLLLDTHVLLLALADPDRLPAAARALIEDAENEIFYSAANLWEIAIKGALGRADFSADAAEVLAAMPQTGFAELPVRARHAAEFSRLPPIHEDPFDRMLIAQARAEPMVLLTNDALLAGYPAAVHLLDT